MAIQSANAAVFRVTRIAGLSISQLYFASILLLLDRWPENRGRIMRPTGTPGVAPEYILALSSTVAIYVPALKTFREEMMKAVLSGAQCATHVIDHDELQMQANQHCPVPSSCPNLTMWSRMPWTGGTVNPRSSECANSRDALVEEPQPGRRPGWEELREAPIQCARPNCESSRPTPNLAVPRWRR